MKQYVSPALLLKEYDLDTAVATTSGTEYDAYDNAKDGGNMDW